MKRPPGRLIEGEFNEGLMMEHRSGAAVVGIDPGLDGAVALILPGRVEAHVTPTLAPGRGGKRRFDSAGMVALLEAHPVDLAAIEQVGPMPKQGVVSTFRFGEGYGLWLGMLSALRIPFVTAAPQAWKAAVLAGTARDKAAAVAFAQRRFPGVSLLATPRCRAPHDGLADALCLAEYARRLLLGGRADTGTASCRHAVTSRRG
jgi:crossover junction endodeoxyribonuclease RuvC